MYSKLGDEFSLLRNVPIVDIKNAGFEMLAEGVDKMRKKKVIVEPGYDGVYGTIKVFKSSAWNIQMI